jgi:hypothetical protein
MIAVIFLFWFNILLEKLILYFYGLTHSQCNYLLH